LNIKLRGCDVVSLKVEDVAPHGHAVDRANVRQRKTGQPVRFEMSKQTREATDNYLRAANKKPGEFLFAGGQNLTITKRQYARLVSQWIASIGLNPSFFGTHSLRRTKATLIYRRTGNLRAVQLFPVTRHTAREHPTEAKVHYPYHPQFGEAVIVRRRLVTHNVEMAVILQPDGSLACLPAWMLAESAAQHRICGSPTI